jgi:hypothetical protein
MADIIERLEMSRSRAAAWLLDRLSTNGCPLGADSGNSWWRVPWALAVAGEREAAARLLGWVEREALDADADLREGPARGSQPASPVYQLAHLAIGASMVGFYDLSERLCQRVRHYQHPYGRGILAFRAGDRGEQEMLFTTQLGLLGVVTGHREMADDAYAWLCRLWEAQPDLGALKLYTRLDDQGLVTQFDEKSSRQAVVDFNLPQQMYFHPGAAAAFLADYAMRFGEPKAVPLARAMMQLNIEGDQGVQFDDLTSVQICKFGWGAAELLRADPEGGWLPHVLRMAGWFIERQDDVGAWAPSSFSIDRSPTDQDKMWKTAEHLMEVCQIQIALAGLGTRIPSPVSPVHAATSH